MSLDKTLSWRLYGALQQEFYAEFNIFFDEVNAAESVSEILEARDPIAVKKATKAGIRRLASLTHREDFTLAVTESLAEITSRESSIMSRLDIPAHALDRVCRDVRDLNLPEGSAAQFFGGAFNAMNPSHSAGQGAMIGTTIGTLILPGIGSMVGGALGAMLGQNSVDEQQTAIFEEFDNCAAAMLEAAAHCFNDVWDGLTDSMAGHTGLLSSKKLEAYRDEWSTMYTSLAERLSQETAQEERQLVQDFLNRSGDMPEAVNCFVRLSLPPFAFANESLRRKAEEMTTHFSYEPAAWESLADCEIALGDFQAAARACDHGLRNNPSHEGLLLSSIEALMASNRVKQAQVVLASADEMELIDGRKHYARGQVRAGDYEGAALTLTSWGTEVGAAAAIARLAAQDDVLCDLQERGFLKAPDRATSMRGSVEAYMPADDELTFYRLPPGQAGQNACSEFLKLSNKGGNKEEVLYFYDWSMWSNGKTGFAITTRRVQWKCMWQEPVRFHLHKLSPEDVGVDEENLQIGDEYVDMEIEGLAQAAATVILELIEISKTT